MTEAYITGARGFLGSHLQERVHATPILHDRIQTTSLGAFERFYFLSAYGNMAHHTEDGKITRANVTDLITVLDQIDFNDGLKSFVYVSSSSVKLKTQTMYSRTKKAAEEILLSYMEKYNAPITIIRPYSITGVGEQKEHLIPKLIRSCLRGEEMPFVPNAVHDFIDVDDIVEGILTLSSRHARGIFELGTGKSYANQQVLETVEAVTGKRARIQIVSNLRGYDTDEWVSRNFTARQYGWEPKKTLEDSIREMVAYETQEHI